MLQIIEDYWLLFLIGQYPHGPLGGLAMTMIMATLGLALSFPFAILLALGPAQFLPVAARPGHGNRAYRAWPAADHVHLLGLLCRPARRGTFRRRRRDIGDRTRPLRGKLPLGDHQGRASRGCRGDSSRRRNRLA